MKFDKNLQPSFFGYEYHKNRDHFAENRPDKKSSNHIHVLKLKDTIVYSHTRIREIKFNSYQILLIWGQRIQK